VSTNIHLIQHPIGGKGEIICLDSHQMNFTELVPGIREIFKTLFNEEAVSFADSLFQFLKYKMNQR